MKAPTDSWRAWMMARDNDEDRKAKYKLTREGILTVKRMLEETI